MNLDELVQLAEVEKLTVGPDQVLLVRLPKGADSASSVIYVKSVISDRLGIERSLVIPHDVEFAVIDAKQAADIERRQAKT